MNYEKYLKNIDNNHIAEYKLNRLKWIDKLIYEYCNTRTLLPEYSHLMCQSTGSVGNISQLVSHLYFFNTDCKEIYVDFFVRRGEYLKIRQKTEENLYDKVFKQHLTNKFTYVDCWANLLSENDYDSFILNDIRKSVKQYFNFQDELIHTKNTIKKDFLIGENTLGVHIRLNDWNICHGKTWGYVYIENYIKEIDYKLDNSNITNIFVASDNSESLIKLENRYGNKITYLTGISRFNKEEENDFDTIYNNFDLRLSNEHDFITPFIDFLILCECGHVITRNHSNFGNAIIYLGNAKFENIIIIPQK